LRGDLAPVLLVHSDRGSQYASKTHRDLVTGMSRKGNCRES